jgi:hypothetical protein
LCTHLGSPRAKLFLTNFSTKFTAACFSKACLRSAHELFLQLHNLRPLQRTNTIDSFGHLIPLIPFTCSPAEHVANSTAFILSTSTSRPSISSITSIFSDQPTYLYNITLRVWTQAVLLRCPTTTSRPVMDWECPVLALLPDEQMLPSSASTSNPPSSPTPKTMVHQHLAPPDLTCLQV